MMIRVPILFDMLHIILSEKFEFEHKPKVSTLDKDGLESKTFGDFDENILNHSLKSTVCQIFFNLCHEP